MISPNQTHEWPINARKDAHHSSLGTRAPKDPRMGPPAGCRGAGRAAASGTAQVGGRALARRVRPGRGLRVHRGRRCASRATAGRPARSSSTARPPGPRRARSADTGCGCDVGALSASSGHPAPGGRPRSRGRAGAARAPRVPARSGMRRAALAQLTDHGENH